ncbi:MAG: KamA family radical SAM protein [Candidatus Altiarchaeota archaeon]
MKEIYLSDVWFTNHKIRDILVESQNLEDARDNLYSYFNDLEKELHIKKVDLHALEKMNVRWCLKVLKNLLIPKNEKLAGFSVLEYLRDIAKEKPVQPKPSVGFLYEFLHLFKGSLGLSGMYSKTGFVDKKDIPKFLRMYNRPAAIERSKTLTADGKNILERIKKFPSGLESKIIKKRQKNRRRILGAIGGSESDWNDYQWQLAHVAHDAKTLESWVSLSPEERQGIELAVENHIPFGVTPYYASLMDEGIQRKFDHAIRAQVIPPITYARLMTEYRHDRKNKMDFMREADTSPIDLVTRRYPHVAILKPYNTCAQICVYCQRNWEVRRVSSPNAIASKKEIKAALEWFSEHEEIHDILITGGDPLVMKDSLIKWGLDKIAEMPHIIRIRIGTRTPVVLPMRLTDDLTELLKSYHKPGYRQFCVVTHFQHPYEITPESRDAVAKLKDNGISFYNQQVFTVDNSRKFETCALRMALCKIGVDPYYLFYAKGKKGMRNYRTPIARILQERKEEARFLPGLTRTDEPVFNVPRLGKCHLRAWQDHEVISILPNGSRVYEFHPWEKNLVPVNPYIQEDVSIYDYLVELEKRGEKYEDYKNIWWYY